MECVCGKGGGRGGPVCVATVAGLHAGVPDGGVLHRQPRQQQVTCEGSRSAPSELRHRHTYTHRGTRDGQISPFLFSFLFLFLQVRLSLAFEIIKG